MWASVPSLYLDNTLYFYKNVFKREISSADSRFMNFVDRVMLLSDVSIFESLSVEYYNIIDSFRVNSRISVVIKRSVSSIKLCYFSNNPISLPPRIFESKTLVVLQLESAILIDVPDYVLLPSLKILHLVNIIKYKNENSAQKLFSGCPVFEELYIQRWRLDTRFALEVSVPTLKYLRLRNTFNPDYSLAASSVFQIDAPKLEFLDIQDYVTQKIYINNFSSITKARIDLYGYIDVLSKLFERVKGVKSLFLCEGTLNTFRLYYPSRDNLPSFQNLVRLELEAVADHGWDMLAVFLGLSPNLEVLILHKKDPFQYYDKLYASDNSWNVPPASEESTLLLHLKEVNIGVFNGYKFEIKAISFILRKAISLKTMTIDCRSVKRDMRKTLTGLRRFT